MMPVPTDRLFAKTMGIPDLLEKPQGVALHFPGTDEEFLHTWGLFYNPNSLRCSSAKTFDFPAVLIDMNLSIGTVGERTRWWKAWVKFCTIAESACFPIEANRLRCFITDQYFCFNRGGLILPFKGMLQMFKVVMTTNDLIVEWNKLADKAMSTLKELVTLSKTRNKGRLPKAIPLITASVTNKMFECSLWQDGGEGSDISCEKIPLPVAHLTTLLVIHHMTALRVTELHQITMPKLRESLARGEGSGEVPFQVELTNSKGQRLARAKGGRERHEVALIFSIDRPWDPVAGIRRLLTAFPAARGPITRDIVMTKPSGRTRPLNPSFPRKLTGWVSPDWTDPKPKVMPISKYGRVLKVCYAATRCLKPGTIKLISGKTPRKITASVMARGGQATSAVFLDLFRWTSLGTSKAYVKVAHETRIHSVKQAMRWVKTPLSPDEIGEMAWERKRTLQGEKSISEESSSEESEAGEVVASTALDIHVPSDEWDESSSDSYDKSSSEEEVKVLCEGEDTPTRRYPRRRRVAPAPMYYPNESLSHHRPRKGKIRGSENTGGGDSNSSSQEDSGGFESRCTHGDACLACGPLAGMGVTLEEAVEMIEFQKVLKKKERERKKREKSFIIQPT